MITPDRSNAVKALQAAQDEIDRLPEGRVPSEVVTASSQRAQVFATAAVAHALLDVAAAIRETRQERHV